MMASSSSPSGLSSKFSSSDTSHASYHYNYYEISTRTKTLFLGLLYFIQGFPYGFQDKLIPLLLIVKGHSPSTIGLMRLLLIPWLTKAFFAPLIDMTLTITKWISITLIGLILISLYNTLLPDSTIRRAVAIDNDDNVDVDGQISNQFILTLFLLNFFSAFQDIAVDAIAVNIYTKHNDVLSGNAGQVVGYKLGAFFGSGILFWIYTLFDWNGLFATLTLIYLFVLIIFNTFSNHLIRSSSLSSTPNLIIKNEENFDEDDNNNNNIDETEQTVSKQTMNENSPSSSSSSPSFDIRRHHQQRQISLNDWSFVMVLLYVFVYKLGESGAMATYPFFLVSNGGMSSHHIAFWNGTIGVLCSIFGSIIASKFSILILPKLIKFRLLPLMLQLATILFERFDLIKTFYQSPLIYYISLMSILLLHLIGGLVTTLTFTLMMMTCQQQNIMQQPLSNVQKHYREVKKIPFVATRYTIMSTVEVLGKLFLSSISGFVVEYGGGFFFAQLMFLLLSILPYYILKKKQLKSIIEN